MVRGKPWPTEDDPTSCEREREKDGGNERGGFDEWVELLSTQEIQPTTGRKRETGGGVSGIVTLACDTPVTSLLYPRLCPSSP